MYESLTPSRPLTSPTIIGQIWIYSNPSLTLTISPGQIPTHDLSKRYLSVPMIMYGWKVCESVVELVKLFNIVYISFF